MHRATSRNNQYGWDRDNTCGATPQPNPWRATWADFWDEARLGHMLKLAKREGASFPQEEELRRKVGAAEGICLPFPCPCLKNARGSHPHGSCAEVALTVAMVTYVLRLSPMMAQVHSILSKHETVPSLVHGDLWGGNAGATTDGEPVIFDPATYYGTALPDWHAWALRRNHHLALGLSVMSRPPSRWGFPL